MDKNRLNTKKGINLTPLDRRVIENLSMSAKHILRKESNLLVNIFLEDAEPTLPRCVVRSWKFEYTAVQIASLSLN